MEWRASVGEWTPFKEEEFLPHVLPRERVPLATAVRGTILVGSMRSLQKRELKGKYLALLDRLHHPLVESLTAASWLPIDFALAHYGTCDRLSLDRETIEAIGAESGRFVNATVLAVVAKVSQGSGVTPWFALSNSHKLVERTLVGSSVAIARLGPKEARFEWIQLPIARIPYFRTAFVGFLRGILGMFAQTIYVREVPSNDTETTVTLPHLLGMKKTCGACVRSCRHPRTRAGESLAPTQRRGPIAPRRSCTRDGR